MSQFPEQPPTFPQPVKQPGDGLATAALVLGIIGFLTSFFLGGFLFGIIGLILAFVAMGQGFRGGKLTAGLILSIVGILFSIGTIVACTACVNSPFWIEIWDDVLWELGL
ncbi:MAG: DUF4190 domain-containing protein [Defluviitaleaceae bacterium]|nr:DUF4190 domain-containing protein [Defluviitaleaceae bacterium]